MTVISSVDTIPYSPFNGTGTVGIVVTNGISTYFKVRGTQLDRIVSVDWYPKKHGSVEFTTRGMILVDDTLGTFMIMVTDNHLNDSDRAGRISFRLDSGVTLNFPAKTFGRVSFGPMWTAPDQGLSTG